MSYLEVGVSICVGISTLAGFFFIKQRPRTTGEKLPAKQRRLVLLEAAGDLAKAKIAIQDADIPKPRSGEVLIKMASAPVNPSDFASWMQKAGDDPVVMGNEGAGTVIASGGGVVAGSMVGKKVGCLGGPSYQQYCCVNAMTSAWPLDQTMPVEDAASFFVNPYTAVGILDTAKNRGSNALIHTAAASQLGQMMVKLAPKVGMTIVNVVRRQDQAEMLAQIGAKHVVVMKDGWEKELADLVKTLNITVAFECIAGDMTATIVSLMPAGSSTFLYGGLSEKAVSGLNPIDLIYHRKKLEGWMVRHWLLSGSPLAQLRRVRHAQALVNPALKQGGWASSSFEDVSMDDMWAKLLELKNKQGAGGFTGRKLRIRIDQA
jgi:NADPH:quinone reductase-like Zn-dependent oxidoreductase